MTILNGLFDTQLTVINMGLTSFKDSLDAVGTPVIHVDWRPIAGGDPEMIDALNKLNGACRAPGDEKKETDND